MVMGAPVRDSRSGAPFPPNYNLSESCQYLSLNDNNPRWSSNQYPAHTPQLTLSSLLFRSASKKSLDLKGHLKMTRISILLLLLELLFPCGYTVPFDHLPTLRFVECMKRPQMSGSQQLRPEQDCPLPMSPVRQALSYLPALSCFPIIGSPKLPIHLFD